MAGPETAAQAGVLELGRPYQERVELWSTQGNLEQERVWERTKREHPGEYRTENRDLKSLEPVDVIWEQSQVDLEPEGSIWRVWNRTAQFQENVELRTQSLESLELRVQCQERLNLERKTLGSRAGAQTHEGHESHVLILVGGNRTLVR